MKLTPENINDLKTATHAETLFRIARFLLNDHFYRVSYQTFVVEHTRPYKDNRVKINSKDKSESILYYLDSEDNVKLIFYRTKVNGKWEYYKLGTALLEKHAVVYPLFLSPFNVSISYRDPKVDIKLSKRGRAKETTITDLRGWLLRYEISILAFNVMKKFDIDNTLKQFNITLGINVLDIDKKNLNWGRLSTEIQEKMMNAIREEVERYYGHKIF